MIIVPKFHILHYIVVAIVFSVVTWCAGPKFAGKILSFDVNRFFKSDTPCWESNNTGFVGSLKNSDIDFSPVAAKLFNQE